MTLEEIIRKHALKNAVDYGKANAGAVAGKVIGELPDAKKDMKDTMQAIHKTITEISRLSRSEIEKELTHYSFVEKKQVEKKLALPNAMDGKVVTRFPPEPSGYPHIGHAKAAFIDSEAAREYGGTFIVRFDDTNPEKESQEFVDAIRMGLKWLGISWMAESYTSDHMAGIYTLAQKLLEKEKAYVCTCDQDTISRLRTEEKACACHALAEVRHSQRWQDMLSGKLSQGQAILRFKGDLHSLNSVMRDPTLARIIIAPHYRQGSQYRVWPSYDLAVVAMDQIEGITHPMRTKEYELRNELYYALCDALGFERPTLISFARLEIKNAPISKRLLKPLVEGGKVDGWSDPRLPTLAALERRGMLPEAIQRFVLRFGISKSESEPDWKILLSENRKLLDPVAPHYFFVPGPVRLFAGHKGEVSYALKGVQRKVHIDGYLYIPQADFGALKKDELFALKDLAFCKWIGKTPNGETLIEIRQAEIPEKKIQWVSAVEAVPCQVLKPGDLLGPDGKFNPASMEIIDGYCEKACLQLKEGDTIQFERFGFCRLDKKTKDKLFFVFSC